MIIDHRQIQLVGRGRDRPVGDTSRDYYPESKRQYTNNANNPREAIL